MRKVLMLLFGVALVLAYTLPAQAAGKYLGGGDFQFRLQGWIWAFDSDNNGDFDDNTHDGRGYVAQRFRWYFDSSFEGKYGATIGFEYDWVWGSDTTDANGRYHFPNLDPRSPFYGAGVGSSPNGDDLYNSEVKHAYIWFMVPHTPVKVTAGLGVQTGLDPHVIMHGYDDYFGVRMDVPLVKGLLNLTAEWLKRDEGEDFPPGYTTPINGDQDGAEADEYDIKLSGSIPNANWFTWGTYHKWLHVRDQGWVNLDEGSTYPFLGGRFAFPARAGDYLWHDIYVNLKPGIFYANADFNYFWGSSDDPLIVGGVQTREDDPSGFAVLAGFGIRPGPFKLGVRGWYFSGNDKSPGDRDFEWNRWVSPNGFFAPLEFFYSGYDSWRGGLTGYEGAPGGSAFAGLDTNWQATKKLLLSLLAGYIWATSEDDKPAASLYDEHGRRNDDQGLGFEADLKADYKIYDHLLLTLGCAYFFADSGLDHYDFGAWQAGEADDGYKLFWRLFYSF